MSELPHDDAEMLADLFRLFPVSDEYRITLVDRMEVELVESD